MSNDDSRTNPGPGYSPPQGYPQQPPQYMPPSGGYPPPQHQQPYGQAPYGQPPYGASQQPGYPPPQGGGFPGGYAPPPYGGQPGGQPPKRGTGLIVAIIAGVLGLLLLVVGAFWALRAGVESMKPAPISTATTAPTEGSPDLEDELADLGDLDASVFPEKIGDYEFDSSFGLLSYMKGLTSVVTLMGVGNAGSGDMDFEFWREGIVEQTELAGGKAFCGDSEGEYLCFVDSESQGVMMVYGLNVSTQDMQLIASTLAEEIA